MKALTLTMPRLGETMEEGQIVGWMVAPGEAFRRGQPILELETDKTVVEFPALGDGVIDATMAGPGDRIAVGAPIAQARVSNPADWSDDTPDPAGATEATPSLLRMPRLGETMEEGVIVNWLVAEGAAYARGDAILEIETDKTVAEVPALYEGRLLRILAAPGSRLAVGAPIAEVDGVVEGMEIPPETAGPAAQPASAAIAPAGRAATVPGERLRATPLARRIARQRGLRLDDIPGTGRRGRIERADVERADPRITGPMPSGDGQSLNLPGGRLAYGVSGTGGETFVLVHGFAGDRSAWAVLAAALARAGHTVVLPDLPGHGATTVAAAAPGDLADALTRLAETLPGRITLVGHSLGAVAAVIAAGRLGPKIARLVLITPAGCGPRINADFVHGMAAATSAGEVAHLLRLLGPKAGMLSDAALSQMADEMGRGRLTLLAGAVATADGRQKLDILRPMEQLAAELPVTAIFGTADKVVEVRDAQGLPPLVAVHFLPTGHMPQWDAPREVAQIILKGGHHG